VLSVGEPAASLAAGLKRGYIFGEIEWTNVGKKP